MDQAFIIYELAKSAQVAGHLLRNLDCFDMGQFIAKAGITLQWKIDLLEEFGFPQYAQLGEAALLSLKASKGKQYLLRSFLSAWEFESIEFANYEEVEQQLENSPWKSWHILDVWENGLKTWSFYYTSSYLIYFTHWEAVSKGDTDALLFAPNNMRTLDLPVPFQVGDLLEIDCTPFAPVKNAVVLSENMQIVFLNSNGELCIDSLKSGCMFGTGKHNVIPPLYGADLVKYSNDYILLALRDYIGGKAENAEKILHCFQKYSKGSNRLEQGYFLWCMEQSGEMVSDYF